MSLWVAIPCPVMKPDAEILTHCLTEMSARYGGALYVGDSEVDEATALAAHIPFALYTGGYRKKAVNAFQCAFSFERYDKLLAMIIEHFGPVMRRL